ncbi:MAG TPA: hypothetical protein VGG29_13620 [Caulobacteraceae bacterium]|jgi:hypothetical protein
MSPLAIAGVSLVGAAALGGGLLAGYLAPDTPPPPVVAVARRAPPADAGPLRAPGAEDLAAIDALASDLAVAPTAGPAAARAPRPRGAAFNPAPVRHDVGPIFRAEASAVIRLPDRRLAVVLAPGAGQGRSRTLRVGDLFDDRWRLTALTTNEAVLGDGASVERVALFGRPGAAGPSGAAGQ